MLGCGRSRSHGRRPGHQLARSRVTLAPVSVATWQACPCGPVGGTVSLSCKRSSELHFQPQGLSTCPCGHARRGGWLDHAAATVTSSDSRVSLLKSETPREDFIRHPVQFGDGVPGDSRVNRGTESGPGATGPGCPRPATSGAGEARSNSELNQQSESHRSVASVLRDRSAVTLRLSYPVGHRYQ
jgi:hypothetical protein